METSSTAPLENLGRRDLSLSALILVLATIASVCFFVPKVQARDLTAGQPAPPLLLHTLDGKNIATKDLTGQLVFITFWATYCDPCREELPLLSAYAKEHEKEGLKVLGFSLDDPANLDEVKKVANTLNFPVGLLSSSYKSNRAQDYGRIWRMPVSFIIDRKGILVYNGWDDKHPVWTKEKLKSTLEPLLNN